MTPQESSLLNDLVAKVQQTQLPEKDSEAEQFLQQHLGQSPDSLYVLAQTVIVQNMALERAKAQLQQLQQQLQQQQSQSQSHGSFLGNLLGRHDPQPPPSPAYPQRPPTPPAQYYPPVPAYPPASAYPPAYAPEYPAAPPPSGGSSFLRTAATTAAGVAAGALAFEGVESLLHGFGHGGGAFGGNEGLGGFGSFGGGGFNQRPEETVINNYYDDPNQNPGSFGAGGERESSSDRAGFDDRGGNFGNDSGATLHDASYEPGRDAFTDPQGIDTLDDADQSTAGIDDSSSFDDSSNFDSGGDDASDV